MAFLGIFGDLEMFVMVALSLHWPRVLCFILLIFNYSEHFKVLKILAAFPVRHCLKLTRILMSLRSSE